MAPAGALGRSDRATGLGNKAQRIAGRSRSRRAAWSSVATGERFSRRPKPAQQSICHPLPERLTPRMSDSIKGCP